MATSLLQTKLYIPPMRPELVPRPRLVAQLNAGVGQNSGFARKLTLISAPAGFGKTTLLSEWICGRGAATAPQVAWLSLDKGDNDLTLFLTYLIAALQTIEGDVGQGALAALESPGEIDVESVLTLLLNEVAGLPDSPPWSPEKGLVLVLDDYHVIESPPIGKALTFLLDHLPPQMHLVIATRSDPFLPLSRLRARGQMTDIRADDLRFSLQEMATFLNRAMGLALSAAQIAALEIRTEGWIAGLQLAALSIKGCQKTGEDAGAFIAAFSGDDRYIADYMVDEVLARQPGGIRDFMLHTSILDRMSGPLCDAVCLDESRARTSQDVLAQLERANLFIVPLDNRRQWYRYHHLFADLLRAHLRQSQPQLEAMLHARASRWFEQHGLAAEAVHHAFAGLDFERAASLIEHNTVAMFPRGKLHTLLRWVKVLPEEWIRRRPWLCIYQAWTLAFAGQLDGVEPLLQEVEPLAQSAGLRADGSTGQAMRGNIAAMRAFIGSVTGHPERAGEQANLARVILPDADLWARSVAEWALGRAYRMQGDLNRAAGVFAKVVRLGRAMDNVWTIVVGLTDLAMVRSTQGRLCQALDLYREALQVATQHSVLNLGYMGRVEAGLAGVLCEQNDLDSAHRFAAQAVEKTKLWKNPNNVAFAYIMLARVLHARGDPQGALERLQNAEQVSQEYPILPSLVRLIEKYKVRLWLSQPDSRAGLSTAERWAQESGVSELEEKETFSEGQEFRLTALAQTLIAKHKTDRALHLLSRLAESALAGGRTSTLIEILALQALALQAQGDRVQAIVAIEHALGLAAPGGYVRVFVDQGKPMGVLLRQSMSCDVDQDYVARLLAAFEATDQQSGGVDGPAFERRATPVHSFALVEPLSKREVDVLRMLKTELTGPEIAHELVISLNTVRTHTKNIYGKLGVNSRRQAVARAESLGLL